MSLPEAPVITEAQEILHKLKEQAARIDTLTEAVNGLGQNVQWIVDNVQGIFAMFSSPQFAAMLSQGIAGMSQQGGESNGG